MTAAEGRGQTGSWSIYRTQVGFDVDSKRWLLALERVHVLQEPTARR